jgi:folate-binding protein YgfZ
MFQDNCFFEEKYSSIIKVTGPDKFSFLQGIISNDVEILKTKLSLYAAILTPQGKYLSDFFLSMYQDNILIEVKSKNLDLVIKKLSMFKLRSNVSFEVITNFKIYLLNESSVKIFEKERNKKIFNDPRFKNLFHRVYIFGKHKIFNLENNGFSPLKQDQYHSLRLLNAIPDFTLDAISNKSLLMEMRFDRLNGISWNKGCYLGQEITARMYYRKITKRQLYQVKIKFNTFIDDKILLDGVEIGFMTSYDEENGLAYISNNVLEDCREKCLKSGDSTLNISDPWWSNNSNS